LRESRKDRLFNKLWQPTFEELRNVHTDYIEMLEACLDDLEVIADAPGNGETQRQLKDVTRALRTGRLKYEPVRRHLLAILDEAQNYGYNDIEEEYLSSLIHYFPSISNRRLTTAASESLTLLEALNEVLTSNEYEPKYFSDSLKNTYVEMKGALRKMRKSWDRVCKSYSRLQHENSRLDVH
jgi:hypothetical protein